MGGEGDRDNFELWRNRLCATVPLSWVWVVPGYIMQCEVITRGGWCGPDLAPPPYYGIGGGLFLIPPLLSTAGSIGIKSFQISTFGLLF